MGFNLLEWDDQKIEDINGVEEISHRDLAIIGMAVKFPKAETVDGFWENLKHGVDCVDHIPQNRKGDADHYLAALGMARDPVRYQKSGYLKNIDEFDYHFFKISPKEAALMDPHQRIFLETALSAVEDAGYAGNKIRGSATGVYVGFSSTELYDYKRMIAETVPEARPIAVSGNIVPIIAGRVSYALDLDGPAMTVDTACSSSLVAFHLACQGIKAGDCEMAVVGGVKVQLLPLEQEEKLGIESQDGITRPFDQAAAGTVISEGAAAVMIKPLHKALRDGDPVYAVVKGSAVNQDGKSVGITAPNGAAQTKVIVKAWKDAQVDPEDIFYIEAHGTGTNIGDPIEIEGIRRAFETYTKKKQFCAIGSVKGNLGHLDCAAGIAGLIKTALTLYYGEIPPSIHFKRPNEKLRLHETAVYLNSRLRKYEQGTRLRYAGVSAFGLSGTNCHVVLEKAPFVESERGEEGGFPRILTISAKSKASLKGLLKSYQEYLENHPELTIEDVSYTLNTGRAHHTYRLAVLAATIQSLREKISMILYLQTIEEAGRIEDVYYGSIEEALSATCQDRIHIIRKNDQQELKAGCQSYVEGKNIAWESLFAHEKRTILRLPTYAFERTRCWLEAKQPENIYYHALWKRSAMTYERKKEFTGITLILKDTRKMADALIERLRDWGKEWIALSLSDSFRKVDGHSYEITGTEEEFSAVFQDHDTGRIDRIIHLSSVTGQGEAATLEEQERQLRIGVDSLRHMVKALKRTADPLKADLILVSEYAHGVTEKQAYVKPANASFFGMGKVVAMENPLVTCRCVDLDGATAAETLIEDLFSEQAGYLSAYREGVRYTEEIAAWDPEALREDAVRIKKGGVYLIAGGTGIIGLEMARYLAAREKVHLVLVSRSSLPERSQWSRYADTPVYRKIRGILELEEAGSSVTACRADISKEEEAAACVAYVLDTFGRIDGVINSAGVGIAAESVEGAGEEDFDGVTAAKIAGTWLLDKATQAMDLDFFIVCSSVITLIGGVRAAAYTVGNTYLDAFTEYRNRKGRRTLTINWAMWEDTFQKYVADGNKDAEKYQNRQIFQVLPKQSAREAFHTILRYRVNRVIVGKLNVGSELFLLRKELPFTWSEAIQGTLAKARSMAKTSGSKADLSVRLLGREEAGYTEKEREVAKIFAGVLGYREIHVDDNFYELGGDSIFILRVLNQISERMGIDVSLEDFVENSTVAKLSGFLERGSKDLGGGKEQKPLYPKYQPDRENLYEPFPLTQVQMAYMMGRNELFEMGGISTHVYTEMELSLDISRLESCINHVIRRHPMLRAVMLPDGTQKILERVPWYRLKAEDLTGLPEEAKKRRLLEERNRMSHDVFDTAAYPLYEFRAFRLSRGAHYLCVGMDVLIADGASMNIIMNDVIEAYFHYGEAGQPFLSPPDREQSSGLREASYGQAAAPSRSGSDPAPDSGFTGELPDFTFRDYVLACRDLETSAVYERDQQYWLNKLEDFPKPPALPCTGNPTEIKKPRFTRLSRRIPKERWNDLKSFARKQNLSPSALLCTAYTEVLSFWSGQPRLAVNLTLFNRYPFHQDVDRLVGDFTSLMLLDIDHQGAGSFLEKARNVQRVMMEALEHRHYDGIEFIRDLSRYHGLGTKAALPYVFTSMLFGDKSYASLGHDAYYTVKYRVTQTPQVYLDHQAAEDNGNLELSWDYVEGLFEEEMIGQMFAAYVSLLMGLDEAKAGDLPQAPQKDRELVERYHATQAAVGEGTLASLLIRQALRTPDRIAVESGDEKLTYRGLHRASDRVAHDLKAKGVVPGDCVCVMGERHSDTVVSVLGILKAGAAYVPVDPEYPADRKNQIIELCGAGLVLDRPYLREILESEELPEEPVDDSRPDGVAYVIFTSGSTGVPKGVVISHEAAVNTVLDMNRRFGVTENDRILGISSLCFDLSVYDLFGSLSTGATLVPVNHPRDAAELLSHLSGKRITLWNSVPAVMELMLDSLPEDFIGDTLSRVFLSGDFIPVSLPDRIRKYFPFAQIISLGGATEASIWSVYYPIEQVKENWTSIPYGMPLANQTLSILNHEGKINPVNVPGEICIGGKGLANGYLHDEEKTSAAFITHPALGRLYRTGDHGIFRREGYIEILGRTDQQVKIKGYRIELGEIESVLAKYPAVQHAVVTVRSDSGGMKYLCGYVTAGEAVSPKEIKAYLASKLPEYMVPQYITVLDEWVLTPNGKVDRKNLPEPDRNRCASEEAWISPSNEVEEKLAGIWSGILGSDRIGVEQNFFDLGGDSFSLVKMQKEIERIYPGKLTITDIFANPTISMLTRHIMGDESGHEGGASGKKESGFQNSADGREEAGHYEQQLSRMIDQVREGTLDIQEAVHAIVGKGRQNG
ncbi:MAG: amino acid adenylation domain-containing protein [Clostridium sp.]|jgi:amino acid adenylation domain-containing protein|nr:amino acid adenylation domain-containing protein [Clostridium sp.]